MDLKRYLDLVVFSIGGLDFTWSKLLLSLITIIGVMILLWLGRKRLFPFLLGEEKDISPIFKRFKRQFFLVLLLVLLLGLWTTLGLDLNLEQLGEQELEPEVTPDEEAPSGPLAGIRLTVSVLLASMLTWQISRLIVSLFEVISIERYFPSKSVTSTGRSRPQKIKAQEQLRAKRNLKYFVRTLAILIIISLLNIDFQITQFTINKNQFTIRISNLISAILIFLLARLVVWLSVRVFLSRIYNQREIDPGSQYAVNQLFRYVVYFVALLLMLNVMGVNPTVLAGSAAALLLGIGLGLQQTFNDFFSGILLLFERSVEVGDVIDVDGLVGTVQRIGMRASHIQTRDNLTVIVPNSRLVVNSLVNWSHTDLVARFQVNVGVAYSSDPEKIKALLVEVANEHKKVQNFPEPFVRFADFGDSSLNFEIHFWTGELIRIEFLKSDLRFAIMKKFREHDIEIPFPQRDLWVRSAGPSNPD